MVKRRVPDNQYQIDFTGVALFADRHLADTYEDKQSEIDAQNFLNNGQNADQIIRQYLRAQQNSLAITETNKKKRSQYTQKN